MLRLRCVPFITKKALASTTSEARMTEVDVVVIIFSAHPVDKLISRNFNPLMNNIRILYLTKRLGKYKILSLVRVKITSP